MYNIVDAIYQMVVSQLFPKILNEKNYNSLTYECKN